MNKSIFLIITALGLSFPGRGASGAPIVSTQVILYPGASAIDQTIWESTQTGAITRGLSTSFGTSRYNALASARATYGSLGAIAQLIISDYPSQSYFVPCPDRPDYTCGRGTYYDIGLSAVSARARFDDHLTITGGYGEAFAVFEFDVDGTSLLQTSGGSGIDRSYAGFFLLVNSGEHFGLVNYGTTYGPKHLVSKPLAVRYNEPFPLSVSFSAMIHPWDVHPESGPYDVMGSALFGASATMIKLSLYSDITLNNSITNFAVSSDSGTQYPGGVPLSAIPEPGTIFLFVTGLAGTVGVARKRRKKRDSERAPVATETPFGGSTSQRSATTTEPGRHLDP